MGKTEKRRLLIIGGSFTGLVVAKDLRNKFHVTVVDAKEFFEYTPGILRAYVKPAHFDSLSFTLNDVIERKLGCKFIWGEVKKLDGKSQRATIKPMYSTETEDIEFDYCCIASGCNFNFLHKWGQSLWFPTIYEDAIPEGDWKHLDERFIEGRRRHILEEYHKLKELNKRGASILVSGAGFIGVEWVTELAHFFPNLKLTILDFLPNCLGPLPVAAQNYCDNYMANAGINVYYNTKYEPEKQEFWDKIGLPNKADETYICMGVKASSYFMPPETLSEKGPGGGGWILMNKHLQVIDRSDQIWGNGNIFAIGDCNYGCIGGPDDWKKGEGMNPIPKISYPGEEQAVHVVRNIAILDQKKYPSGCFTMCCAPPKNLKTTWWPWGAGMFATSLGTEDACFVAGANHNKGSGIMCVWGWPCVLQKEIIETSQVDKCKGGFIGFMIWHFVHHTPVHLWGKGPFFP